MHNKILYEHADYCLRASLYCTGQVLQKQFDYYTIMLDMFFECEPESLWARKSRQYTWSKSEGLTRWLYDYFFKFIGLDFYKGLNGDQLRAYFTYLHAIKDQTAARTIWSNFKKRLGMYPSMMEHFIFKPQSLVLLFDLIKKDSIWLNLLAKISKQFFKWSVKRNLKESTSVSTTNKISMLPTMKLLGFDMPSDDYIKSVYNIYFKGTSIPSTMLRESLIKGVCK